MRCKACDVNLSDNESTRKSESTGEYMDLCNHCFSTIASEVLTRDDSEVEYLHDEYDEDGAEFRDEQVND
jgi:hypothetical protein